MRPNHTSDPTPVNRDVTATVIATAKLNASISAKTDSRLAVMLIALRDNGSLDGYKLRNYPASAY